MIILFKNLKVYSLLVPGYLLNIGLLLISSTTLRDGHFGAFYGFVSIINICTIPISFITSVAQNSFASFLSQKSQAQINTTRRDTLQGINILCILALAIYAIVSFGAYRLLPNIQMLWLTAFVSVFLIFMIELLKCFFLVTDQFNTFSLITPAWLFLRFVFVVSIIFVVPTASCAAVGVMVAPAPIFIFLAIKYSSGYISFLKIKRLISLGVIFLKPSRRFVNNFLLLLCFAVFAYLDIIFIYLTYDILALEAFSHSALLPKTLLLLIGPLTSVVIDANHKDQLRNVRTLELTALAFVLLGTLCAPIVIQQFNPGNNCFYGLFLMHCEPNLFFISWASCLTLCISRVCLSLSLVTKKRQHFVFPLFFLMISFLFIERSSFFDSSVAIPFLLVSSLYALYCVTVTLNTRPFKR